MASGKQRNVTVVPRHVAVVMDGNGRWARQRLLPRPAGHKAGVDATRRLVELCVQKGISCLTVFAFSSENWSRPEEEVSSLMSLFLSTLNAELYKLNEQGVRLRFIGDRTRFSTALQSTIEDAESTTAKNARLCLNIAANYGGRWDIVNAVRKVSQKLLAGDLTLQQLTEQLISQEISLADIPEPDLFIRTGGEQRISNFLLWQIAYTELFFTETLWPAFDEAAFDEALQWYATRQRRFGKTGEQIESARGRQRS